MLLHCIGPLELVSLYALLNYRAGNANICFSFLWCFQIGKHDEAWMILKQVHDTNMRAKGEPERVFTVSLTKPSTCKKKSWTYLPWCVTASIYSSLGLFQCNLPQQSGKGLWDTFCAFKVRCQSVFSRISWSCELQWVLFIPGVTLQHIDQWFSSYTNA